MDKYVLPDLRYDYGALEPHVSGRIMELHHDKHHAGYVNGANETLEKLHEARVQVTSPVWRRWKGPWPSTCPATSSTRSSGRTSPRGGRSSRAGRSQRQSTGTSAASAPSSGR